VSGRLSLVGEPWHARVGDADEAEWAAGHAAIASHEVAVLELGRPEIGNELEPVAFQKCRDRPFADPEDAWLAELFHPSLGLCAAVVVAAAIGEAFVVVVEHE